PPFCQNMRARLPLQITALKKENFNLKLRIYFMEERMQQKCDDSTEDIFKTLRGRWTR
uniref:Centrosomin N-terminal motif 1 domain-containing protein n=1 Tax=Oryzias latipes TaxID=8090 RepID=A0A3P9KGQ6_ORYLA